jgi:uncharacterized protein
LSLLVRASSRTRLWALAALSFSLLPLAALAQPKAPPLPANFFTDTVGVVPPGLGARIEQRLRDLQKESSNQVLVVVADRLPEGYASLEEYTNRTAEAWRVGDKSRDNGAVVFVFVGDRKVRIEVGYGLEGALPDALASRIVNDEITPRFKEGKYGEGLLAGVEAIILATRGEYQSFPTEPQTVSQMYWALYARFPILVSVVSILILGQLVWFLFLLPDLARQSRTYSSHGSSRDGRWGSSGSSWGGWSGGGGGSWGGGGGFSGGGGSFGGGGASGSW